MLKTNKKGSDVICLFNNFESVKIRQENVKKHKSVYKKENAEIGILQNFIN